MIIESVGYAIDAAGVGVIVIGVAAATVWFCFNAGKLGLLNGYTAFRQTIGRVILLGLELLVGGDIIRTVAVAPTLQNVAVLGGIVVIRTFLSMSLELELEGRWPWQRATEKK